MFRYIAIIIMLISLSKGAPSLFPENLKKIVGGHDAYIEDYPYQASVLMNDGHICGGALISDIYILTAASCARFTLSAYSVRLGSDKISSGGIIMNVTKIFLHPEYNPNTYDNDIAILQLSENVSFCDTVQPIQLPFEDENLANGSILTITGFGALNEDEMEGSEQLQAVYVDKISNERCQEMYLTEIISASMICTYTAGKDACQGDSGDPLVANSQLYGLVSWGRGCAQINFAGVNSYIPHLRNFIRNVTSV